MSGWDEAMGATKQESSEKADEKPAARKTLTMKRADTVKATVLRYLWEHRIPVGAMTLMPGEEGIGKTTVGVRIMADITRGRLPGEFEGQPRDVVVIALEDQLEAVFKPRLVAAGADETRIHIITAAKDATTGETDDLVLPDDLDALSEVIDGLDVAMVWVDSLVTTLPDDIKTIAYKDTAKVLRRLGAWAEQEKVSVVAPWHLNKNKGSDTAVRIMDSRAFRTAVRSMLLVVADPEDVTQGLVVLDKANAGTLKVDGLKYRIEGVMVETDEGPTSAGMVTWTDTIDGATAREVARGIMDDGMKKSGGGNAVEKWLTDYLMENGETERKIVVAAGVAAGHSESGLKRAASTLGVMSRVVTGQEDGRPYRRSMWSLYSVGHDTHPTEPTDPTGEIVVGLTDPFAQVSPSGVSQVSGVTVGNADPTGEPTEDEDVVVDLTKWKGWA